VYRLIEKIKGNILIFLIFGLGLISRLIFRPLDFNLFKMLVSFRHTFFYTIIFFVINSFFELNVNKERDENIIPFAPFIFLGTIVTNTNFTNWAMNALNLIGKL
jgi:prepilin signal peptidase PulO-like enzyme (type II secretory pathway)